METAGAGEWSREAPAVVISWAARGPPSRAGRDGEWRKEERDEKEEEGRGEAERGEEMGGKQGEGEEEGRQRRKKVGGGEGKEMVGEGMQEARGGT